MTDKTDQSSRPGTVDSVSPPVRSAPLGASSSVALGMLLSRITGLIRERVVGHYFGVSPVAGVFRAAFRIPVLLGTLFGEGVLSAAFVTVYSRLRALHEEDQADHLAAAVFGVLALVSSLIVLAGVLATPLLIDVIAPGFHGEDRALTIRLVRIFFPANGILVMSAWCLGVLNSHRKFLLSYSAPIAMNATMIAALVFFSQHHLAPRQAVIYLAWATVLGGFFQFAVQLPSVLRLLPAFRPVLDFTSQHVKTVMRNFGPVFVSRGVVQISAYIDQIIASLLGPIAVSTLGYGQIIGVLPVSLFSASISAAELPALSSAVGTPDEIATVLRSRLLAGLRRIAFFIIPCAVAFFAIGDVLVGALYQGGRFDHSATVYVWSVLAGSSIGLLATSLGRLYSSVFYALHDTRTPLRFAVIRVAVTTVLGLLFALWLPKWLGVDPNWGVAGLTASAGIAGWIEFVLLRHALGQRIGTTPLTFGFTVRLWAIAFTAAAVSYSLKASLGVQHPLLLALLVVPLYAVIYFSGTAFLGIAESKSTISSLKRRLRPAR